MKTMVRITNSGVVFIILIALSCGRFSDNTDLTVFSRNKAAEWIGDGRALPQSDSLFYLDQPAPISVKGSTTLYMMSHLRKFSCWIQINKR